MKPFFNGSFFGGGFFVSASTKRGSNWLSKRKQDDEQVLLAVLHCYMQLSQTKGNYYAKEAHNA